MLSPILPPPGLSTGQKLTLDEFLSRWERLPELKNAELIDGVVYVPSPVGLEHGDIDSLIHWWLKQYALATPGCRAGNNSTWLMLGSAPQPDANLRILPSHGGQSGSLHGMGSGAPELVVEISFTSTDIDFGPKLALYQKAGVQEYITVERFPQRVTWRMLEDGMYLALRLPPDGILRSRVFPGLWLHEAAFLADDGAKMLAALNAGLASAEHQQFVARLTSSSPAQPPLP